MASRKVKYLKIKLTENLELTEVYKLSNPVSTKKALKWINR